MSSPDQLLMLGAMVFIVGTPLVLLLWWRRASRQRGRLIVIFGALTPALAVCAYATVRHLFRPDEEISTWAFYAFWAMTLPSYVMCLVLGIALSFLRRPAHFAGRYLLGFLSPLSVALLLAALQ